MKHSTRGHSTRSTSPTPLPTSGLGLALGVGWVAFVFLAFIVGIFVLGAL
ncbi:hypothetical protein [Streptomyces sp. NPDC093795]